MTVWCIAGRMTTDALAVARHLLERGDRLAIVTPNVEECAGLVNEHGDAVLPVRVDSSDVDSSTFATEIIAECFDEVDQIRVVPEHGGPLRVDVALLGLRWPTASIGMLDLDANATGAPGAHARK